MQPENLIHQADLDAYCQQVYQRINRAWQGMPPSFTTKECRFSILYGPPIFNPDIMIIGTNPGYNPEDLYDAEIYTWPSENEYWAKDWALAKKLRKFFSDAGIGHTLKASVGTNFLFFKSRAIKSDGRGLCWEDNPKLLREAMEELCLTEVTGLVERIQPKLIVVLGLGVFDKYCVASQNVLSATGRVIGKFGTFTGINSIGIMHPTGARISNADMALLIEYIKNRIPNPSTQPNLLFIDSHTQIKSNQNQRHLRSESVHIAPLYIASVPASGKEAPSQKATLAVCFVLGALLFLSLVIFGEEKIVEFLIFIFAGLLIVAGVNPILFVLDLIILWLLWHIL